MEYKNPTTLKVSSKSTKGNMTKRFKRYWEFIRDVSYGRHSNIPWCCVMEYSVVHFLGGFAISTLGERKSRHDFIRNSLPPSSLYEPKYSPCTQCTLEHVAMLKLPNISHQCTMDEFWCRRYCGDYLRRVESINREWVETRTKNDIIRD